MRALPLLLASALASCGWVGFGRKVGDEELRLRSEVRAYYDDVARAFASANADALTRQFAPEIAKPMTREQIQAWGERFFKEHGPAKFKVLAVDYERLGHVSAVVLLTYRVETSDGKGGFEGTERDELARRGRTWVVTAWEKAESPKKAAP